jgi:hypothetical protein
MDANTIISCVCAEKILDIYPSHVVGVSGCHTCKVLPSLCFGFTNLGN